jgi:hypothetical protein
VKAPGLGGITPTVLRWGPYRFFFYSNEGREPPHVHVEGSSGYAKMWLTPIRLARAGGMRPGEVALLLRFVRAHQASLLRSWHEYFRE